jgi:hypothetical protein
LLLLSSIILPFGNFGEDYDISAQSSMEKWQTGAKIGSFEEGMQQSLRDYVPVNVVPAQAGTQVLREQS